MKPRIGIWHLAFQLKLERDVSQFQLIDNCKILLVVSIKRLPNRDYEIWLQIEAFDGANGKKLWEWLGPKDFGTLAFMQDIPKMKQIEFGYMTYPDRNFDSSLKSFSIDYDGSHATEFATPPPIFAWHRNVDYISKSRDRRFSIEPGIQPTLFTLHDGEDRDFEYEFNAPVEKINSMGISNSGEFAAGIVNDNSVAIWTRRRQHVEWWGIYEQKEFWLAALFFAALLWSVFRDRKDKDFRGNAGCLTISSPPHP